MKLRPVEVGVIWIVSERRLKRKGRIIHFPLSQQLGCGRDGEPALILETDSVFTDGRATRVWVPGQCCGQDLLTVLDTHQLRLYKKETLTPVFLKPLLFWFLVTQQDQYPE